MSRRLSRNAPCPCGSGKKYKQCCIRKDIDYVEMDDGSTAREIELSDETVEALEAVKRFQIAKFGSVQERVFDGAPPMEHLEHWTVQAMQKAGIDPAMIYAYEETRGLMIGETNEKRTPDVDVAEWDRAIDEYERKHGVKAKRRRLTDEDFSAILASGPGSPTSQFVERLPVPPPFQKEDWSTIRLTDLTKETPVGEYFQECIAQAARQRGETYLRMFCAMAHTGGRYSKDADYGSIMAKGLDREFDADELWAGLESVFLTCQPEGGMPNAAAAFEFLSFIADCIGQYAEHIGAAEELADVFERIRFTALTAFVAALGAELGVQKDRWRRSRKPGR